MHKLFMIDTSPYIKSSLICLCDVTIACSGQPHPCVTFAKKNFYLENLKLINEKVSLLTPLLRQIQNF